MKPIWRAWAVWIVVLPVLSLTSLAKVGKLAFDRLSLEQGLSQTLVRAIIQDQEGFLWIGTMEGLNRYDGYSFTVFRHDPRNMRSLSRDYITAIAQDATGRIWVGTEEGGVNVFDPATGDFTRFLHDEKRENSIGSDSIGAIGVSPDGTVWIGTDVGVDRFDPASRSFSHYPIAVPDKQNLLVIRAIQPSVKEAGILWLGTNQGLFRLSSPGGSSRRFFHVEKDENTLISNDIYAVYESPSAPGSVWVGTLSGLDLFDVATKRFRHWLHSAENTDSISSNRVRAIFKDREGAMWIGTDGGGLNRFDPATGIFTRYLNDPRDVTSIAQNSVLAIFQDRSGFLWLGTSGGGLNRINFQKSRFIRYRNEPGVGDSLQMDDVLSICESRREPQILWVGNQDGGLNRLDRLSGKVKHFLSDPADTNTLSHNSIYAILEIPDGSLWLGTGNGLNFFNSHTGHFARFHHDPDRPDSLPQDFILTLFRDRHDRLWVGTRSAGLALMNGMEDRFTTFQSNPEDPKTISGNGIMSIRESRDDRDVLWVSTSNGLNRLDTRSQVFQRYMIEIPGTQRSDINYIMDLIESRAEPGVLWMTTQDGLVRFDSNRGVFTRIREGLPANFIYSLISSTGGPGDIDEYLWLSTSKGLSRYHPRSGRFKNFGWTEGIQVSDFNRGASFQSPSGEIFFGGTLGMYAFFPSSIEENPHPPPVLITSIKVNEKEVSPLKPILDKKAITLDYNQNFISFEFTALDFTIPDKNRFAYQMEGIDSDWVFRESSRRFASYTGVNPGKYVFRVKASNNDGVWNESGFSLRVVVRPPFWQTWWFYLLAGTLILASVYGMYRGRVRSLEKRQRVLEALVDQRTLELKEASLKDPLTGLRNRRYIAEVIQNESRAFLSSKDFYVKHGSTRRNQALDRQEYGIFMLDIDHFKTVNDEYGHEAGDRLLMELSGILVSSIRQDDVVVRMGGEEFLVILKKTTPGYVDEFAVKIKKAIGDHDFSLSATMPSLKKTCSLGYTTLPFYSDEPERVILEQAIGLADLGLLHAKKIGRNRVTRIKPTANRIPPEEFARALSSLEYSLGKGWIEISTD